jgi:GH24 family phage-related lysozyme (muramidase)
MKMARFDNAGLTLLKRFEGCRLEAYQDSAGIWTIGYGHIEGVSEGQTVTQAQADAFLCDDAAHTLTVLNLLTGGVTTAGFQLNACVTPSRPETPCCRC